MYPIHRQWLGADIFEMQVNSVLKSKHFPKGKREISVALTNNVVRLENSSKCLFHYLVLI